MVMYVMPHKCQHSKDSQFLKVLKLFGARNGLIYMAPKELTGGRARVSPL